MQIGFQGEFGAFSDLVAREVFKVDAPTVPCRTFREVFERVASGELERGVIPIENSLTGTIHRNYDLLLEFGLTIIGERSLPISHCLIASPGVMLDEIRRVVSHPQALAQCEQRLETMGLCCEVAYDTAGSVRDLAGSNHRDTAALASQLAAEVYGMQVLASEMQDNPHNTTRFLILAREPQMAEGELPSGEELKTSLAISLRNGPGALFKALAVFALRDIDLTKLESRPVPSQRWEYMFYIDFVTDDFEKRGRRAIANLEEVCCMLHVLGTYPRSDRDSRM